MKMTYRHTLDRGMEGVFVGCSWACVLALAVLGWAIVRDGWGMVDWDFLVSFPSRVPERAGIRAAWAGTLWVIGLTSVIAVPLGVGAAVYLEELKVGRSAFWRFVELNIANLAGVPSIVYGIFGLTLFVRGLGLGRGVLAGALTLVLLILPAIILTTREALRAVPMSVRHAAYALGANRWETTVGHVIPAAAPGILTGLILSVSRAMGETAPLIMIGAITYVAFVPTKWDDPFTVLPIQIFNWASRPDTAFHQLAAAAIIVLVVVLLGMNAIAIGLRNRLDRRHLW